MDHNFFFCFLIVNRIILLKCPHSKMSDFLVHNFIDEATRVMKIRIAYLPTIDAFSKMHFCFHYWGSQQHKDHILNYHWYIHKHDFLLIVLGKINKIRIPYLITLVFRKMIFCWQCWGSPKIIIPYLITSDTFSQMTFHWQEVVILITK